MVRLRVGRVRDTSLRAFRELEKSRASNKIRNESDAWWRAKAERSEYTNTVVVPRISDVRRNARSPSLNRLRFKFPVRITTKILNSLSIHMGGGARKNIDLLAHEYTRVKNCKGNLVPFRRFSPDVVSIPISRGPQLGGRGKWDFFRFVVKLASFKKKCLKKVGGSYCVSERKKKKTKTKMTVIDV